MAQLAGLVLAVCWGPALAVDYEETLTYQIYIYGEHAGTCQIKPIVSPDRIVFETESEVRFEEFVQDLKCQTEVDPETFFTRRFVYEGESAGKQVSGSVWVSGDSILGDLYENGINFPSSRLTALPTVMFENYILDHPLCLFSALAASSEPYVRFLLFYPSSFSGTTATGLLESEIELQATSPPTVCEKYVVEVSNGAPFGAYFDRNRGAPIYLDFPGANTEVFLESAFEEIITKYTRDEEAGDHGHEGHSH